MIAIGLSKKQAPDADPKAIQQINFTGNLDRAENTRFYFILEEAKETLFEFWQGTAKVSKCNFIECNIIKRFNFYQHKNDTIQ